MTTDPPHGPLHILLVDDEPGLRRTLEEALRDAGHDVTVSTDGAQGLTHALSRVFDVVICDVRLPKVDGLTLFRRLRRESPSTKVIMMTAYAGVAEAVAALKEGAYDYLTKPFDLDELLLQLERIATEQALKNELASARAELSGRSPSTTLVGQSPVMRRVTDLIATVAPSDAPTLVTGESGTGKELVARMLHERSPRRDKPFVIVNCGALAEGVVEAELFGHERGAFTGADKKREGRFKAADGGTIFLDEIAELPAPVQAKLLRVLQEGTFEPVGSNSTLTVDVRLISATHRNLPERIRKGLFREDLYYRINVIEIALPPLRERPGDLIVLIQHLLQRFTPTGRALPVMSPAAWAAISQYQFPGNVRELSHAIQHATVLSGGGEIDLHHLPTTIHSGPVSALPSSSATGGGGERAGAAPAAAAPGGELAPLATAVRAFERQYLTRAIERAGGKRAQAAQLLGISRKTLWEKLRSYEIAADESEE
jgi:two-component system response regulator AtoC